MTVEPIVHGTRIEWTHLPGYKGDTWNPVTGCSKVSPGCAHCYAETLALTRLKGHRGYDGLPWTPQNAEANVLVRPDRLGVVHRWQSPRSVFVNSMSDLFSDQVPDAFLDDVFKVMAEHPQHVFMVLTKRPVRMRDYIRGVLARGPARPPLANVWLGVSAENQHWADQRITTLLEVPAARRFVSCEPLLGPIDLAEFVGGNAHWDDIAGAPTLDWVIVGGESGPKARPMQGDWARQIRDECAAAGTPFFFKQWGQHDESGRRTTKGKAGHLLDGVEHFNWPEVAS